MPRRPASVVLRGPIVLVAASVAAFAVIHLVPGDPAVLTLLAFHQPVTPEAIGALHAAWGLDRPLPMQYAAWLGRFLTGDWGTSFRTGEPVAMEFAMRLPSSLLLGVAGLMLAATAAVGLGFLSARRPGGAADMSIRVLAVLGESVPTFGLGFLLLWVFAVQLGWLQPLAGSGLSRFVLPTAVIAFSAVGPLARVHRAALLEVRSQPWFVAVLAKGCDPRRALWTHGKRHALLALLAAVSGECGWIIGGTAVVEVVFGVGGVSQFLVDSIAARDYLVLQAYLMSMVVWMLAIAAAAAALRRALDPRENLTRGLA